MALARIITRSHPCSRELALDLLARGYAVEVVSPDSIPDNIADLELRVDTGPGDRLIASVEARDGERSASLEFVHHLKAPMVNFIRRPPQPDEALHLAEKPVSFIPAPAIEDIELPAGAPQRAPTAVSPAAEILIAPEPNSRRDARLTPAVDPLLLLPIQLPIQFAPEALPISQPPIAPPTISRPTVVKPAKDPRRRDRSGGWRWRAALVFAGMVLLALVLGFGLRSTGRASAQDSAAAPAVRVVAASNGMDLLSAPDPEKDHGKDLGQISPAVPPPVTKSEGNSGPPSKEPPAARATAASAGTSNARTGIPRRHVDDLIARNTVTYLDERYRPAPKAKPADRFAGRHPSSRKHGRVVAANIVTHLNHHPAPKAAKPNSAVLQPSSLN